MFSVMVSGRLQCCPYVQYIDLPASDRPANPLRLHTWRAMTGFTPRSPLRCHGWRLLPGLFPVIRSAVPWLHARRPDHPLSLFLQACYPCRHSNAALSSLPDCIEGEDMAHYLLAFDQGTTSSRVILFSAEGVPLAQAQKEFRQYYPADGWVEHDAMGIWQDSLALARQVLAEQKVEASQVAAIGITNQREATVLWDRHAGKPLAKAIVWQGRRTADQCARLKAAGHEATVSAKTGLLLDPYFSATKLGWLLDNVPGARARADKGELAFGTIDSWLLWHLTGGQLHATDATNASRTLLFNIHSQQWDDELLALFNIPRALLPEVRDSAADYGRTE